MEEGMNWQKKAKTVSRSIGEKVMAAKDQMVRDKEAAHTLEENFRTKDKAVKAEVEDA